MERIAVGFRVYGDRPNAEFATSTDHPEGDFTTIGYQNFLEQTNPSVEELRA
jgi:hypothetical protein